MAVPPKYRRTRFVCISDTHNQTPKLPAGDVLIHAGDLTNQGSYTELKRAVDWLEKANYEAKIVVAGRWYTPRLTGGCPMPTYTGGEDRQPDASPGSDISSTNMGDAA
jgi:3',5'-cyclic AMP phosphodiesterase CpdA